MTNVTDHQEGLVGEILPPDQLTRRTFNTLTELADYIRAFQITTAGFGHFDCPGIGPRYLLEYPTRFQP